MKRANSTDKAKVRDEDEALEKALATNVLGPFRLTKALLGALAASAREGRGSSSFALQLITDLERRKLTARDR